MGNSEQISWWRTSFGAAELRNVEEAIGGEFISQGPLTARLEAQLAEQLSVPFAVVTTSGSVALLMAFMALGLGAGDEVIMTDRTWIATAHAPLILGAKPVLVEVHRDAPVMDASRIREKITPRTRAILPVHLNGRSCDMETIREIAREHNLFLVEDACQALFSRNASGFLGTQSDIGCFSLGVAKLISSGQGGVMVTHDRELYLKLQAIRSNGVADNFTTSWDQVGLNFKFTDILAGIGLAHLARAKQHIDHVQQIYRLYRERLADLPWLTLIEVDLAGGAVPLYTEVLCSGRDRLIGFLQERGIQARHFLPSLHSAPYLEATGEFPNADRFARDGLFLPCGPAQPLTNVERTCEVLHRFQP
jgi:perosamine synthetase